MENFLKVGVGIAGFFVWKKVKVEKLLDFKDA